MSDASILKQIKSPHDLRRLPVEKLPGLCREIREFLIGVVSGTGGHFASNLGCVELTVALHYVFDTPVDKIVWDVGHQCYTHKILTGRMDRMGSIRQGGGLSGFPSCDESEYDTFVTGHAGTSISSAVGVTEAATLAGEKRRAVAVIGDGSMTAGIAYEALNYAGRLERGPVVVLNDNEMSIDPNVGAMSRFLSRRLVSRRTLALRQSLKKFMHAMGPLGEDVIRVANRIEESTLGLVTPGYFFEDMGYSYVGPLDGHDVLMLVDAFKDIIHVTKPVLAHVLTVKGKGYIPAENQPHMYHGVSPFDVKTGVVKKKADPKSPKSYSQVFGETMVELAHQDTGIVGISAAMFAGTGLNILSKAFPDRCFDVGIAEQHAVAFAAGLAKMGYKPVAAIYSTFLQRAYDQVIHDVLLQKLPVVFAMDRAGLVGADGPTHHGVFDIAFLRHLPGIIVMAPKDEGELRHMLHSAIEYNRAVAIRYPRGKGAGVPTDDEAKILPIGKGELLRQGKDAVIIAYGSRVMPAFAAAEVLKDQGLEIAVINARFAKPLDEELIIEWAKKTGRVVTVEEGTRLGGFGSAVLELLADNDLTDIKTHVVGLPDEFIPHGAQSDLDAACGIDEKGIAEAVKKILG